MSVPSYPNHTFITYTGNYKWAINSNKTFASPPFGWDKILWKVPKSVLFKFKVDIRLFLAVSYLTHSTNKWCRSSTTPHCSQLGEVVFLIKNANLLHNSIIVVLSKSKYLLINHNWINRC